MEYLAYAYYLQNRDLAIIENGTSSWVSISDAGRKIRYRAICYNTPFTEDLTEEPEFDERFHELVAYKAISMGYEDPRNFQIDAASFFNNKFKHGVREARKYIYSHNRMSHDIKPHYF